RVGALGKVSASGGACSDALPLAPGQANQAWPQFLPDGRHVIFREFRGIFGRSPGDVFVGALDGGDSRRLLHIDAADSAARFASPASLLVVRQGALVSYAIDPAQGVVRGDPATVAGLGEIAEGAGVPGFSVSDTGVLAYRAQLVAARTSQLAWVDRTGAVLGTIGKSGATTLSDVQLSPDGRQVTGFRDGAVWLLDVNRGIDTRLTGRRAQPGEAAESAQFGVWSRDGRRVAFRSVRDGRGNLFEMPADGTGTERRLIDTPETKTPLDWSPDGRVLAYQVLDPATGFDIWALPLTGDGKPFPILNGKANEGGAQFSPDGRWLAYQSDESGDPEVFVQPFPGPGRRVQVSSGGGTRPRWRPDGKELFYLANDLKLMAVPIAAGRDAQALDPGAPMPLFQTQVVYTNSLGMEKPNYAVAPDGQRFLINTVTGDPQPSPITVVLNWPALLKKP
ncbi:MAG: TolB family protein, partial [Vicinamibacterales bacterium]